MDDNVGMSVGIWNGVVFGWTMVTGVVISSRGSIAVGFASAAALVFFSYSSSFATQSKVFDGLTVRTWSPKVLVVTGERVVVGKPPRATVVHLPSVYIVRGSRGRIAISSGLARMVVGGPTTAPS